MCGDSKDWASWIQIQISPDIILIYQPLHLIPSIHKLSYSRVKNGLIWSVTETLPPTLSPPTTNLQCLTCTIWFHTKLCFVFTTYTNLIVFSGNLICVQVVWQNSTQPVQVFCYYQVYIDLYLIHVVDWDFQNKPSLHITGFLFTATIPNASVAKAVNIVMVWVDLVYIDVTVNGYCR